MEESSEKIDPGRLNNFVRHVCIIAKKHKDREDARSELHKQIKRLKKFSSNKKDMDQELKELDRKVSLVLDKEVQLLKIKERESPASKELMDNVLSNRARMNQINDVINEVKKKIDSYIDVKTARDKKIEELEKKIADKAKHKKSFSLLKTQLKKLETSYNKLKKKGVDVAKLEDRIQDLKIRLNLC